MAILKLACLAFLLVFVVCDKPGVVLRLTENGMNYVVDVGVSIMKKEITKESRDIRGGGSGARYEIKNFVVTYADFGKYELKPSKNEGMSGHFSGINIGATGKLTVKYFFLPFHADMHVHVKDVAFEMAVNIGADQHGRPTIGVDSCAASVEDVTLYFHGTITAGILELVKPLIEHEVEGSFKSLLCGMVEKEIRTKARSELATFPVTKKIDEWAEIDYSLIEGPRFTDQYMDAYLKGEFKSSVEPVESPLAVPTIPLSSDAQKMLYVWVTDYTLKTAADVYQKAGRLAVSFAAWDEKTPESLKKLLNTAHFSLIIPTLAKLFPNALMGVNVTSYQSPHVTISEEEVKLKLFSHVMFKVKNKNGKIQDVFSIKFDIKAAASVGAENDKIVGKIDEFDYTAEIDHSFIGKISVDLNSWLVKSFVDAAVISQTNPILARGFPLPKVDEGRMENFEVKVLKDAIQIGSDVKYVEAK